MPNKQESLTKLTGRAIKWSYFGVFTRIAVGSGINILLTRLLGPRPFGELAVCNIVFGLGNMLASVGVTSALIQKQELVEGDVRFCFTVQMLVGTVMTGLLILTAPAWARFFHEPDVVPVLRVFSLLFIFQTFGTTSVALLSRKQDARTIQIIIIVSYLISYLGVGVPLALYAAGIWSLVGAQLSQALLFSVLIYTRARHSIVPLLHRRHMGLLTFGFRVLGANFCSLGIITLDNTIVGRFAGPVPLGLYSRSYTLAAMPGDAIVVSLMQVMLPALSRVQSDLLKLRQIYASARGLVLLVLAPMFAAMAAVPDVVILGLYGKKWAGAVPLFQPLALAIPIYAVMALSGPMLAARGKPQREFRALLITVIAAIISYIIAIQWSVAALSWTVLAVYVLRFVLLTRAVNSEIGGRWKDLLGTAWPSLTLASVAAVSAKLLDAFVPRFSDPVRLVIVGGGSALCVTLCFAISSRVLLRPMLNSFPQLQTLLPSKLRRFAQ